MLTFSKLAKKPALFKQMTGVGADQCAQLVATIQPYWEEAERERLSRPDRHRAIGAGARYHLPTLADRISVLLIYYRIIRGFRRNFPMRTFPTRKRRAGRY